VKAGATASHSSDIVLLGGLAADPECFLEQPIVKGEVRARRRAADDSEHGHAPRPPTRRCWHDRRRRAGGGCRTLLQALLAGVSPTDLLSFGGAAVLAVVMTTIGSALGAIRVDPLRVIRSE
jgi:hypothetical protein